ncbi:hypothetical protein P280DRAFT_472070 [Massarina eburnea CBS 473.64]|uniref:Uncharacterized protein n=1 Tax=Massarina eburnea CBS 473.64 TaxID=1395130 RepID=A0A6A6RQI8_9PLEO|nr:hypothetical protein P280DRAFT_472070 [Massarina eburnea CBS 473.64]
MSTQTEATTTTRRLLSSPMSSREESDEKTMIKPLKSPPSTRKSLPSRVRRRFPFIGTTVTFPDESQWAIREGLSDLKLQQDYIPCEASQVYLVECLADPQDLYDGLKEAVVKVKFQIRASSDTLRELEEWLDENEAYYERNPDCETGKEMERTRSALHLGTSCTSNPNRETLKEVHALNLLDSHRGGHAPYLFDFSVATIEKRGYHYDEIVGGYLVFILMPKVPGLRIEHRWYWFLSKGKRDEIREAFKKALLSVWDCGIEPHDISLDNLMWNEEKRKCYILKFKDCTFFNEKKGGTKPEWTDKLWECWQLAEH